MIKALVNILGSDIARRELILWLRERGSILIKEHSLTQWDFGRPFYAFVVGVRGTRLNGLIGFNVYSDGEIKLVSREAVGGGDEQTYLY